MAWFVQVLVLALVWTILALELVLVSELATTAALDVFSVLAHFGDHLTVLLSRYNLLESPAHEIPDQHLTVLLSRYNLLESPSHEIPDEHLAVLLSRYNY